MSKKIASIPMNEYLELLEMKKAMFDNKIVVQESRFSLMGQWHEHKYYTSDELVKELTETINELNIKLSSMQEVLTKTEAKAKMRWFHYFGVSN